MRIESKQQQQQSRARLGDIVPMAKVDVVALIIFVSLDCFDLGYIILFLQAYLREISALRKLRAVFSNVRMHKQRT